MKSDHRARRRGLRVRIAAVSMLVVAGAMAFGAIALVGLLRSNLSSTATSAASVRARDIAALAADGSLPETLALPGEEAALVQVIDQSGTVIAATRNIKGDPAISNLVPTEAAPIITTIRPSLLGERISLRLVAVRATSPSGPLSVYAAESLEGFDEVTRKVAIVLFASVPVLAAGVGALAWWAVGRSLRPVDNITRTLADITATDLHRRVDEPARSDEIGHLANVVNQTLARLETAVDRQLRFVADASHELRGPLSSLRADVEISLLHPERTEWRPVAEDLLTDIDRLQYLTEDLLLLARLDRPITSPNEPVQLAPLLADVIASVRRPGIDIDCRLASETTVITGNAAQLHHMLRNVVHNAEAHALSRVSIKASLDAGWVQITVADDGAGIEPEHRARVFERFVRLDDARTRTTGGTGLGLAIVRDVVIWHGGTVAIHETDPHGATFSIKLPVNGTSGRRPGP